MPVPAAERLAQIQELRAQGLSNKHIGLRLGISESTVRNRLYDPDGSKGRELKKRYRGTCASCGGPTDGGNGRGKAPINCQYCITSKPRPKPAYVRRRIPVRLTEIEFDRRMAAAREACKAEKDARERQLIMWSAIDPSDNVYWVAT